MERCVAVRVCGLQFGPLFDQTFDGWKKAFSGRVHQGCVAVVVLRLLVSILSMLYEQLLRVQIPKEPKKTIQLSIFFAFLGSARVKAASRTLMKLTPGVNFTNQFTRVTEQKKVKSLQGDEGLSNNK